MGKRNKQDSKIHSHKVRGQVRWMNWPAWTCIASYIGAYFCKTELPDSSVGKESTCNVGDPGSIPGLGRSSGEGNHYPLQYSWGLLVAQLVKNLLAMRVTWVQFLVWVDPLEKGTTTHSSILAWRDSPWGCKKSDTTEWLSLSLFCKTNKFQPPRVRNHLVPSALNVSSALNINKENLCHFPGCEF